MYQMALIFKQKRRMLLDYSLLRFLELLFAVVVGTILGILLLAHGAINFGPFNTDFSIKPAFSGVTNVDLGPLGNVAFKSHSGPLAVNIKVKSLNPVTAEKWVTSSTSFKSAPSDAGKVMRDNFTKIALRAIIGGMLLSFILVLISFRKFKIAFIGSLISLLLNLSVSSYAFISYRPNAITQPTYSGLISAAPSLIGSAKDIATNFQHYRSQVAALLDNTSKLYNLTQDSPAYEIPENVVAILHVSDLHLNPAGWDMMHQLVKVYGVKIIVDTGDISDHGTAFEDSFLKEIPTFKIPYLYVRGNHDSKHTQEIIKSFSNVSVLDKGEPVKLLGITFQGMGDPVFTPDKSQNSSEEKVILEEKLYADTLAPMSTDFLLVHDPINAKAFAGKTKIILAGHLHTRNVKRLSPYTLLMLEGSTGGGGLRTVTNRTTPAQLEASILYYDVTSKKLVAYDEISMGGIGTASAQITRKLP